MASCQNWADGYYHAFADIASHAPDLVLHLGDYIYEKPIPDDARHGSPRPVSATHEAVDLDDYRERYALYKSDPDLQQAHATSPFAISFDDHEVDNNWAATVPEDHTAWRRSPSDARARCGRGGRTPRCAPPCDLTAPSSAHTGASSSATSRRSPSSTRAAIAATR
ncbi:putative alkaline phosphatase [Gordonia rubripertincta NBRC 101908]|uniref:Alkaline phosphatase n=1 Tax=Gordonia rubripertincta NBRC 101908 TaxID=1077975 RepID=A0ABQ0HQ19_GORRU|nr:putative alkaline phosphatase [Gordonia rubripertincta NBRC 101908]